MKAARHLFPAILGRLNLWIAALLLLGLLQDPHGALQSRLVQQISAQPAAVQLGAPKFALAKSALPEARARLMPLLDAAQIAQPVPPSGFLLLRSAAPAPAPRAQPRHNWQARAPPVVAIRPS